MNTGDAKYAGILMADYHFRSAYHVSYWQVTARTFQLVTIRNDETEKKEP